MADKYGVKVKNLDDGHKFLTNEHGVQFEAEKWKDGRWAFFLIHIPQRHWSGRSRYRMARTFDEGREHVARCRGEFV